MKGKTSSQVADSYNTAVPKLSTRANMIWNSAGSMTYLACQWLTTVFVVRLSAGYDDAGLLALAMSVVGIFGTFANYKMGTYQISDIKHEHQLSEYLAFRSFTLAIAFVACMVYAFITCAPHAWLTIALFFWFKAVGLIIDILHGADQLARRMDYIGKSFMLQGVSTLAVFVAVYGLTNNLNLAIVGMGIAALLVFVFFDVPHAAQFEPIALHLSRTKAFFFLKTSLPAVIASLAASALFVVPKQYLALAFGDASLGIYSSVAAPALVIQMGAMYLYGPLLDIFPRYYFDNDKKDFFKLLVKTIAGIVLVTIACAVVLQLIGEWALVLLFGESIRPYVYLLQPIIAMTAMTAFLWFFGDLLITLRNFRGNLIGNIVALIVVIATTFPFVQTWEMNGVSFSGIAGCLAGVLVLLFFLLRTLKSYPGPVDITDKQSVYDIEYGADVYVKTSDTVCIAENSDNDAQGCFSNGSASLVKEGSDD